MGDSGTNNDGRGTGDLEKGTPNEIEESESRDHLVTPDANEAQHQVLAAASKPLILTEKIIVSTIIVCFVMVEAYFVGVHFRSWVDKRRHHMNSTDVVPPSSSLVLNRWEQEFVTPGQLQVPLVSSDVVNENFATTEPFEDFEGGLRSGVTKQIFEAVMKKLPPSGQSPRLDLQPTKGMNHLLQTIVQEETKLVREETQF